MSRHTKYRIPKNIHAKPSKPKRFAGRIITIGALAGALALLTYTQLNRMDAVTRPAKTPSTQVGKESKPEFAKKTPLAEDIKLDAGTRDSGVVPGFNAGALMDSGAVEIAAMDAGAPLFDAGISEEKQEGAPQKEVIPQKSGVIDLGEDEVSAAVPQKEKETKKGKKTKKRQRKLTRKEKKERKRILKNMLEMEARINGKPQGIPWGQFYEEYAHMKAVEAGETEEYKSAMARIAKEKKERAEKLKERERLRAEMEKMRARNHVEIDTTRGSPPPKIKKATPGEAIDYVPLKRPLRPRKEYPPGSTPYD